LNSENSDQDVVVQLTVRWPDFSGLFDFFQPSVHLHRKESCSFCLFHPANVFAAAAVRFLAEFR